MSNLVDLDHARGVARLRLTRPLQRNALSTALCRDLLAALAEVDALVQQNVVRCAILHGDGEIFCAGADLRERSAMSPDEASAHSKLIADCADALASAACPVVAAVHGAALGGGFELALAADLRVVANDAVLGFPEVDYGFFPGAGGPVRLVRLVGHSVATRLLVTGERIGGAEAHRLHLAHEVSQPGLHVECAEALAAKIAAKPPEGIRALRTLLSQLDAPETARRQTMAREMRDALNHTSAVQQMAAAGFARTPQTEETS